MGLSDGTNATGADTVTVRFWAAARAAAGTAEESLEVPGPLTVGELLERVLAAHQGAPALARVLGVCSVMVDGRQVRTGDPGRHVVLPGQAVEFLPPFAGG